MSASNAATSAAAQSTSLSSDELATKALHKRYEGLVTVRTKAIKGKGAWYWSHLEPVLVHNSDTGFPKAVKLRCSLCDAVFSASNPSRTASEHLKRGTCQNFASVPEPISSVPPSSVSIAGVPYSLNIPGSSSSTSLTRHNHRKRSSSSGGIHAGEGGGGTTFSPPSFVPSLAIVDPSRFKVDLAYPPAVPIASTSIQNQLVLSGGKDDLDALAMLEDSVKRLKSPKASSRVLTLNKEQVDSAFDLLADWVYDSCGSVSFSSLEHPKFKAFLNQVGLPSVSRREFSGSRLDAKYEEAKAESEAKIHDAMFFQIASDGWKTDDSFVNLAVNLPNGTSVFRKAVFNNGYVFSKFAEETLWDSITEISGSSGHQCVGIVSDKFKAKALRNLENQHPWMVNLCCQYQGFISLINDFGKELLLFKNVSENCLKLANFVNENSQIRRTFQKYQIQEYGHASLLRVPFQGSNFGPAYTLIDDILSSARALQLILLDESYKIVLTEDPIAREIEEMMRNPRFWNEIEAVHSLVKLIKSTAHEIELEKPSIGQCLPLWEEVRAKIKDWCSKFQILESPAQKVLDKRFEKNYHPAWAAAFILNPLYLIRDTSGKYLPPFKYLTPDQEKDVDRLITRLVSREEAHIALMELMKWRTEGLDPVYAQAVQLKQRDPHSGKLKVANPQSSRLVWETYLTEFKYLGKVAVRLIFLHATSCGFKCNRGLLRWVNGVSGSRAGIERAQKLIFIAAHSNMEKRDVSNNEEDRDFDLFSLANGEDDVLNGVFVDTSSVSI